MPIDKQTGLPVDAQGNPDPTGNIGEIPSGQLNSRDLSSIPYGMAGNLFNDRKAQTNPLMSAPAQAVIQSAKKKLNEHLRSLGREMLGPDEDPPALLILIELREFTQEPLKTDAMRALRNMSVYLCTSRDVIAKWGRTPYKSVPYEVRQFPLHVANMILSQIQSFLFVPVQDEKRGIFVGRKMPAHMLIRVSHKRFRQPKDNELTPDRLKRLGNSSKTVVKGQESTGALTVDLEPDENEGTAGDEIQVAGGKVREDHDGNQQYVPESKGVGVNAPPPGSTSIPPAPASDTPQAEAVGGPQATGIPAVGGVPAAATAPAEGGVR